MWKIKIDETNTEQLANLGISTKAANLLGFELKLANNIVEVTPTMLMHKVVGIKEIIEDFIEDIATIIAEVLDTKVTITDSEGNAVFEYDGKATAGGLDAELKDLGNKIGMKVVKWIKGKL